MWTTVAVGAGALVNVYRKSAPTGVPTVKRVVTYGTRAKRGLVLFLVRGGPVLSNTNPAPGINEGMLEHGAAATANQEGLAASTCLQYRGLT